MEVSNIYANLFKNITPPVRDALKSGLIGDVRLLEGIDGKGPQWN